MRIIFSAVMVLALCVVSQVSFAESFKSSDFLKWKRSSQEFYIDTSIGMAILIADQNDKSHAKCVGDWYGNNQEEAYSQVFEAMKKFSNYHPRGVILAVIEKRCGDFTYN